MSAPTIFSVLLPFFTPPPILEGEGRPCDTSLRVSGARALFPRQAPRAHPDGVRLPVPAGAPPAGGCPQPPGRRGVVSDMLRVPEQPVEGLRAHAGARRDAQVQLDGVAAASRGDPRGEGSDLK